MTTPADTPSEFNFTVRGGETCDVFAFAAVDTDGTIIDLTGVEARMEIRAADGSLFLALATSNGSMVNGGTDGTLIGSVGTSIPNTPAEYSYEMWVEDTLGSDHPWWVGRVLVVRSIMGALP